MTEETKHKLREAGREDLINIHEINQSGYAGINSKGMIVDRREFPEAVPVPENRMLNIPAPKEWLHSAITSEKIVRGVWVAKCKAHHPLKVEVTIKGTSEKDAVDKMKAFFES